MKQRLMVAIVLISFCASPAWCKWKKDQQQYLDDAFASLQSRLKALKAQVGALTKQLSSSQQKQADLQSTVAHQEQEIQDLKNTIISLQLAQDSSFNNVNSALAGIRADEQRSLGSLRDAINQLQTEQQKVATAVGTQPRSTPPAANASGEAGGQASPSAAVAKGYVTAVSGDSITIDLGSSSGLQAGSRLDLFKADDPDTQVGVLEVTDVVDAGSAHVKVVSVNRGVKPEFSDIVRLEP